jgi:DHA1 family bicyclomycin/chloramphenicol resistance-like MFS transporter
MHSPLRIAIPLASLTALGLLASDLYLPAIPAMAQTLGASIPAAQATIALFMLALALSQLAWGWLCDRFGDRTAIVAGSVMLAGGSVLCALAPDVTLMLAGRLLQGLGAGAANVAVPALIRRRFGASDAVRALAVVAMAESAIPAIGPVIGASIVLYAGWRATFWIIAVLSLLLLPLISSILGHQAGAPRQRGGPAALAYMRLLRNTEYMRWALSYALMFGALLMLVASAPVVVTVSMGLDIRAFALLQMCAVGAFMVGGMLAVRWVNSLGQNSLVMIGGALQSLAAVAMLVVAAADVYNLATLIALACLFCAGLGLRGAATMGGALHAAGADAGQGSGLLLFMAFGMVAAATMTVAPYLKDHGLLPVAVMLFALVVGSGMLLPSHVWQRPKSSTYSRRRERR